MEGEKNKKNSSFAGYFFKAWYTYYASWTMELWYSKRGVQRSSCVGIETTDGGDQDPGYWSPAALDHPQHTIKLSCLSVNTNNERRAGSRQPHQDIKRNILSEIPHFISKSTNNYCYRAGQMVSISHNLDGVGRLGAGIILSSTTVAFCNLSTSPF